MEALDLQEDGIVRVQGGLRRESADCSKADEHIGSGLVDRPVG